MQDYLNRENVNQKKEKSLLLHTNKLFAHIYFHKKLKTQENNFNPLQKYNKINAIAQKKTL